MEPTLILLTVTMCVYAFTFFLFGYVMSGYCQSVHFYDDSITEEGTNKDGSDEEQIENFIIDIENRHHNLT